MCSTVVADQWKQGTSTISHIGVRLLERRQPLPVVRNHGWLLALLHGGQWWGWSDADGAEGVWEGSVVKEQLHG